MVTESFDALSGSHRKDWPEIWRERSTDAPLAALFPVGK